VDNVIRVVQPAEQFALDPPAGRDGRSTAWFEGVFRDHYPRIAGMLARLTGDRGHAEEIAADVLCKLSRRPPVLENSGDLTAWFYRVATNAGLDAVRSNTRRRRREREAGVESLRIASQSGALDDMLRAERRTRVREVLADLKPRDAQLLLLRAEGLAYRELAETLGIQPGSIGTLLARAEAEFERRFRGKFGDEI
jgi:RNA polymerase sigma-70 factor, ECF subfamily